MGKGQSKEMIEKIGDFKRKIGAERIILFGSYARGDFDEDSDVDLLLVSKKFRKKDFHRRFEGLWLKWDLDLPVDFIPYTPEEFEKLKRRVSIVSEALREGIEI